MRISRGLQRAIGASMVTTPVGAKRHYTMSYADVSNVRLEWVDGMELDRGFDQVSAAEAHPRPSPNFEPPPTTNTPLINHPWLQFVNRLKTDAGFAAWFAPIEESLADLLTGPCWSGEPTFPCHRWSRVLLLQQLLVEAFDLLDPKCLRIMPSRRMRLAPVAYKPLPNLEAYQARLSLLSGGGSVSNCEALANLKDPLAVAKRGGAVVNDSNGVNPLPWLSWPPGNNGNGNGNGKPGGSPGRSPEATPLATVMGSEDGAAAGRASGGAFPAAEASGSSALMATKLPPAPSGAEPVLPLSSVQQQMRQPHAQGGAGGRKDGEALLMDVIGVTLVQRLQQAQLLAQQMAAASQPKDGGGSGDAEGRAAAADAPAPPTTTSTTTTTSSRTHRPSFDE